MKQTANKLNTSGIETTAWELFEVGSYDEVVRLAKSNPANEFLNHIGIISVYESGSTDTHQFIHLGMSPLTPMVESYRSFYNYQYKESAKQAYDYFISGNPLISYTLINFAVKASRQAGFFKQCFEIIHLYKKKTGDESFIREEIEALFNLKKYGELLQKFKEHSAELGDKEMHMMLGLSLYYLGKSREATAVLESIPDRLELPSFEEKKSKYSPVIARIPELEKTTAQMNHQQLSELGFAYLFNEDYKKAEETFSRAITVCK